MPDFVPLKGYEQYYSINKHGVVLNHKKNSKGEPINIVGKPHHSKRVVLRRPYEDSSNVRLDRLVAEHFLERTHTNRYLHNISGDPNDYSADNLEYRHYVQSDAAIEPALLKEISLLYINGLKNTNELAEIAGTNSTNASQKIKEWCTENLIKHQYEARAKINLYKVFRMATTSTGKSIAQFRGKVLIRTFDTVTAAATHVDKAVPTVSAALDKPTRTAGGYTWRSLSKILPSN